MLSVCSSLCFGFGVNFVLTCLENISFIKVPIPSQCVCAHPSVFVISFCFLFFPLSLRRGQYMICFSIWLIICGLWLFRVLVDLFLWVCIYVFLIGICTTEIDIKFQAVCFFLFTLVFCKTFTSLKSCHLAFKCHSKMNSTFCGFLFH